MLGYVLVSLGDSADEKLVLDRISEHENVKNANLLFGEWDIIVQISSGSPELLSAFVLDNIRKMPEVKMTSTLIVAK